MDGSGDSRLQYRVQHQRPRLTPNTIPGHAVQFFAQCQCQYPNPSSQHADSGHMYAVMYKPCPKNTPETSLHGQWFHAISKRNCKSNKCLHIRVPYTEYSSSSKPLGKIITSEMNQNFTWFGTSDCGEPMRISQVDGSNLTPYHDTLQIVRRAANRGHPPLICIYGR